MAALSALNDSLSVSGGIYRTNGNKNASEEIKLQER
jgi:hypothetical protein